MIKKNKKHKFLVAFFIGGSISLIAFTAYFYQMFNSPNIAVDKDNAYIIVPKDATIKHVMDSLLLKGNVNDLISFGAVSRFLDYNTLIKPGYYEFKKNTSNLEAVRILRSGAQTPVRITFSNARTKWDIAERLTKNLQMTPSELVEEMNKKENQTKYGLDTTNIVSLFIPNTYEVYWTITPEELLKRMKREYDQFWSKKRLAKASSIGLTPTQVSILASIVQAETIKEDEKPRVAGLYINRLNRNILLASDPTLVFAWGDFEIKRVLNKHKEINSPYNTYKHTGLPPGPINIPLASSIDAVLNYEKHNYIYMCAKEDFSGYHNFTNSWKQHDRNANKYRKALSKAGIYH